MYITVHSIYLNTVTVKSKICIYISNTDFLAVFFLFMLHVYNILIIVWFLVSLLELQGFINFNQTNYVRFEVYMKLHTSICYSTLINTHFYLLSQVMCGLIIYIYVYESPGSSVSIVTMLKVG